MESSVEDLVTLPTGPRIEELLTLAPGLVESAIQELLTLAPGLAGSSIQELQVLPTGPQK